jgi:hypothetical protein
LLDADDEWKPTFLERTVAAAQRVPGIVAVFTGIHVLDGPAAPLVATEALINDYHAARMRLGISMSSSSVLLRRTTFLSMGGFREDHRYAEDIEAWFRLACEGPSFYVGEALSGIEVSDPGAARRQGDPLERAAGLQMLLDSYEAYRRTARIPPGQARSCRRFMEHQRGRLALHLFNANQRAHGARVLLTGVPFGFHTWREYAQCTAAAFARGRSQDAVDRG